MVVFIIALLIGGLQYVEATVSTTGPVSISCVGDSITVAGGASSYPPVLGQLLG